MLSGIAMSRVIIWITCEIFWVKISIELVLNILIIYQVLLVFFDHLRNHHSIMTLILLLSQACLVEDPICILGNDVRIGSGCSGFNGAIGGTVPTTKL